jgi:DNA processing protein
MIAAGGAVLSPFPPRHAAHPPQFLQRNGIVAALADAVVVIEAPARSGALNTASWAAGRVPVLAVPGDVDRPHVAGCHALIRDGAVLARSAADVLEALHLPQTVLPLVAQSECVDDPIAAALLTMLESGECELNELITANDAEPPLVLSTLTMLELDGRVERMGGSRYARVLR